MKQCYMLVALASILILKNGVQCLRVSRLDIISPTPVKDGSKMTLTCLYNLSRGEQFKGIEWFKDDKLFYHYSSGNDDIFSDRTVSSTDQFEVNISHSDASKVYLENVRRSATGTYKCKVTVKHNRIYHIKSASNEITIEPKV